MKDILTVSQLNENIKTFLEETFGILLVEGEVSNLRRPQSGHVYFTLKDDKSQIRAALAAARFHAARFARQRRLPREDREDLTQDILLVLLEAAPRFDATRASWATFVALLARRAIIDRARRPATPECVSLDGKSGADILCAFVAPAADPDIAVDFARVEEDLPTAPRALLRRRSAW